MPKIARSRFSMLSKFHYLVAVSSSKSTILQIMAEQLRKYRIFISAAEPSADSHCAGLIAAVKQYRRDIEFVGVGGPKMAQAGCRLLEDTAGKAAMIYKAFAHVARYYALIRRITAYLKASKVDLVIVCDSPAFNFHIARAAKKLGIKTIFYVAPQLWAWAGWRIRKLRKCCDRLCCILPFEQEWFSKRGVETVFVGNPLLDDLYGCIGDNFKRYADFDIRIAKIALMPGSRLAEIAALWPQMQRIALRLKQKYPRMTFTAVAVDQKKLQLLKAAEIQGFGCSYTTDGVYAAAADADFAIVASGSATLQVAAAGCGMVVLYQCSRILWHLIGRWLVKSDYLCLVNILAQKKLVPEFMPYLGSIGPIEQTIQALLEDKHSLAQFSEELVRLVKPLAEKNAGDQAAQIAIAMLA